MLKYVTVSFGVPCTALPSNCSKRNKNTSYLIDARLKNNGNNNNNTNKEINRPASFTVYPFSGHLYKGLTVACIAGGFSFSRLCLGPPNPNKTASYAGYKDVYWTFIACLLFACLFCGEGWRGILRLANNGIATEDYGNKTNSKAKFS